MKNVFFLSAAPPTTADRVTAQGTLAVGPSQTFTGGAEGSGRGRA
jgi:hypothetical protein